MLEFKGKYNNDCKVFLDEIEDSCYPLIQSIVDSQVSKNVPIRIMPDTHAGYGIVIGFTMPLGDMIIPEHIGVDIGCGILTAKLNLDASRYNDTTDMYKHIDETIRDIVPMGMNYRNDSVLYDTYFKYDELNILLKKFHDRWCERYETYPCPIIDDMYMDNLTQKIGISKKVTHSSIGTLGGGNHFIELNVNNLGEYFLSIHSGSRNFGHKVCQYHNNIAKQPKVSKSVYNKLRDEIVATYPKNMIKHQLDLLKDEIRNNNNIGYLTNEDMYNYCVDMVIAQYYALVNRRAMLNNIACVLNIDIIDMFDTIHNYIDFDRFIIRKGAISANHGEKCAIPLNMRDGIMICIGKGNHDWNYSAPHGAGRLKSRTQAKQEISLEDFKLSMDGIYSTSVNEYTLDESPMAYKDSKLIQAAIEPTVDIIEIIKPVLNLKSNV